jgi:hypothetical protein
MPALPAGLNTVFDMRWADITSGGGTPSVPGLPPYAARGLKGTLRPIDMAQGGGVLRRTVNGTLVDLSAPQFRKYQLEASGDDQQPPALASMWPGMAFNVDCHVELAYPTGFIVPDRTPVPGSERVEGDYTFFCPSLAMRLQEFSIERDEWGAAVSWALTLVEV